MEKSEGDIGSQCHRALHCLPEPASSTGALVLRLLVGARRLPACPHPPRVQLSRAELSLLPQKLEQQSWA